MAVLLTGLALPAAAVDLREGRNLAKICRQCHAFKIKDPEKFGPSLYGIFGRKAGSVEGYPYSGPMRAATWVWFSETINEFIANPGLYLPGTQMPFSGLPDPQDRVNLIAYLERATRK